MDLFRYCGWLVIVLVNLGLPTILARMIDQGVMQQDQRALYFGL
ncbi:hypothetical protein [Streptococcus equi]